MQTQEFTQTAAFTVVKQTILEHLGVEEHVEPETKIEDDLDIDSIELVELSVKLEKQLNIALKNQDVRRCDTVSDLANLVVIATQRS